MRILINIDDKVLEIKDLLEKGNFKSSPYSFKRIKDDSSGKEREIMRPKFYPDQCVQWAIMQVVEPIILKGHYYHSCGSIPKKGGHFAKRYVQKWIRRDFKNTKYVLQIDVTKYYPSINHAILKGLFKKKIKCQRTLGLIDEIIDGGGIGLPIGNYTSQWFANFYLQETDCFIKKDLGVKYYVRYMDDMVLFGSNKKKLHKTFRIIDKRLNTLCLKSKDNWQVFKFQSRPLDFLGYKFYRTYTTIRKRNSLRMKRRAKKISRKQTFTLKDASAILSYMGWIKSSDSTYFYNKNIKPYVNIGKAKGVVRNESKKRHNAQQH